LFQEKMKQRMPEAAIPGTVNGITIRKRDPQTREEGRP
jgi:hypothetical protein